jgi:hypothetical protein
MFIFSLRLKLTYSIWFKNFWGNSPILKWGMVKFASWTLGGRRFGRRWSAKNVGVTTSPWGILLWPALTRMPLQFSFAIQFHNFSFRQSLLLQVSARLPSCPLNWDSATQSRQWSRHVSLQSPTISSDGTWHLGYIRFSTAWHSVPDTEFGIQVTALSWLRSFITGWSNCVCIGDDQSPTISCSNGVPQGSVGRYLYRGTKSDGASIVEATINRG